MKTKIEPALTPEEWADLEEWDGYVPELDPLLSNHGIAAACLHGEHYGFAWEDVDKLRNAAERLCGDWDNPPEILSVADRIEALLPPREP